MAIMVLPPPLPYPAPTPTLPLPLGRKARVINRRVRLMTAGDEGMLLLLQTTMILRMDKILHYFKYPKLWELWYIPYYG